MVDHRVAHLLLNLKDCAPVDGECVHSPESVAWSPHNVLLVATHWALYLHIRGLVASDFVLRPAYQPRGDTSSMMCITGAKWALDLVPEEAYPATCRLCVRTTRDIYIYRVIRSGKGRIRVSCGVCFIPKVASEEDLDSVAGAERKGRKRARSSFGNIAAPDAENGGKGQLRLSDGPGWCVVSYEWFPLDLLVVVTVGGIYLLNLFDDVSDETELQLRLFPSPAFCFTGSPLASLVASCATRVLGCDRNDYRLVVASPCWLRIFTVSTTHVHLTHYVEVPSLYGVPTALCSMMSDASKSTMRVFVSAPMCILEGNFVVGPSNNVVGEAQQVNWTAVGSWNSEGELGDEVSVRHFLVVPLFSFVPTEASTTLTKRKSTTGESAMDGRDAHYLVLGVCQRRLLGFVGRRCVELLHCLRMNGSEFPRDVALEVLGVTIHPSCTLAVIGVRIGMRQYPPFQLLPVSLNTKGGFLLRLLQLLEGFDSLSDGNGDVATISATAPIDTVLPALWNRQHSTSYFVWEDLLPSSAVASAIAHSHHEETKRVLEFSKIEEEVKDEGGNIHATSSPFFSFYYRVLGAWRRGYLEERQKHGVELFLRFPEANAAWRWALLRIWRRCPGDAALMELVLANAVRRMAEEVHYAGVTRSESTALPLEAADSSYLALLAAVQFGRLYQQQSVKSGTWVYDGGFAEQVGRFVDTVEAQMWRKQRTPQKEKEEQNTLTSHSRFPCSICGREEQTLLTMSLTSTTKVGRNMEGKLQDCATGFHLTVFSGSTFTPLSFVKQDEVLSRCLSCGIYDYATGPLCSVCEGLMM
ncbi:hypothetical protein ECC02_008697 [Trypanosoma cruzi]|uniref:Uncharacterized protein n=1 Tax=Trypanosoma cruzi TaxID=5693 RepID=A0A7J6XV88_TRYCR|nr:hypothetical protein ECC02_008697 [Trypanosoma cruzi]